MNKQEYIIRQIARTNKKGFENYVVTRIWHLLDDLDIKFMTQQYVKRPSGFALTDLYFPQFQLHIEIDEPFHKHYKVEDDERELDIINAIDHELERIKVIDDIVVLHKRIERLVVKIKSYKKAHKQKGKFKEWNPEKEFDLSHLKKKGSFNLEDNAAFRTIKDACNFFGHHYKSCQIALITNKLNPKQHLWFPKFYKNQDWDNQMSSDGKRITEKCNNPDKRQKHFDRITKKPLDRVTFPRVKDNLGFVMYKFKGIFRPNLTESNLDQIIYDRITCEVKIV